MMANPRKASARASQNRRGRYGRVAGGAVKRGCLVNASFRGCQKLGEWVFPCQLSNADRHRTTGRLCSVDGVWLPVVLQNLAQTRSGRHHGGSVIPTGVSGEPFHRTGNRDRSDDWALTVAYRG